MLLGNAARASFRRFVSQAKPPGNTVESSAKKWKLPKRTPEMQRKLFKEQAPPVVSSEEGLGFGKIYIMVAGVTWTIGVQLDLLVGPLALAETFIVLPFQVYRGNFKKDSMGQKEVDVVAQTTVEADGTVTAGVAAAPSLQDQLVALRTLERDVIARPARYGSRDDCLQKVADIGVQKQRIKDQLKAGAT